MLQLLLVTHINREQMATTRAAAAEGAGRETETERAVGCEGGGGRRGAGPDGD